MMQKEKVDAFGQCFCYGLSQLVIVTKEGCHAGGKKVYVPRVEDKNSNMRMLSISRMDDLIANSMNILEPNPIDAEGNVREDGMAPIVLSYVIYIFPVCFLNSLFLLYSY